MSRIAGSQPGQNGSVSAAQGEEQAAAPVDHAHDGSGDITKCPMHHSFI
jgi:hypothetical protein